MESPRIHHQSLHLFGVCKTLPVGVKDINKPSIFGNLYLRHILHIGQRMIASTFTQMPFALTILLSHILLDAISLSYVMNCVKANQELGCYNQKEGILNMKVYKAICRFRE